MTWRDLWYEQKTGRLRCGWRIAAFLGMALLISFLLLLFLALPIMPAVSDPQHIPPSVLAQMMALLYPALLAGFVLAGCWAVRTFDRLPTYTLGLSLRGPWLPSLLASLLTGITLIALMVAALSCSGMATILSHALTMPAWQQWGWAATNLLFPSVLAVVMWYGYAYQTLLRSIGPLPALLLIAGLATGYLTPPNASPIMTMNTLLMSVLFGMLYLRSGSLWAPIGLHLGWTVGLLLFGLPISGVQLVTASPWSLACHAPSWIYDRVYGLEGGAAASIFLLSMLACVSYSRHGLSLASAWWEWRQLTSPLRLPPSWDFSIGTRCYQWKLLARDQAE
ncbi:MAG TPA: CPBP family intramembrane glutamic endopeptidase [Armatimonadota bacterium]|jgi:hypothetical protein